MHTRSILHLAQTWSHPRSSGEAEPKMRWNYFMEEERRGVCSGDGELKQWEVKNLHCLGKRNRWSQPCRLERERERRHFVVKLIKVPRGLISMLDFNFFKSHVKLKNSIKKRYQVRFLAGIYRQRHLNNCFSSIRHLSTKVSIVWKFWRF